MLDVKWCRSFETQSIAPYSKQILLDFHFDFQFHT